MKVGECKRQQFRSYLCKGEGTNEKELLAEGRRGMGTKVLAEKPTVNPLSKNPRRHFSSHPQGAGAGVPAPSTFPPQRGPR